MHFFLALDHESPHHPRYGESLDRASTGNFVHPVLVQNGRKYIIHNVE